MQNYPRIHLYLEADQILSDRIVIQASTANDDADINLVLLFSHQATRAEFSIRIIITGYTESIPPVMFAKNFNNFYATIKSFEDIDQH